MKIAKIGLVVLSALNLCYSAGIGDVIVQDENFVDYNDEDPGVLDLTNLDIDKLISETDDDELDEIFRLTTRVTVSDITLRSLKKLCQYNILIDIESQDNVLDCAEIKEMGRLVKRENDDSEDDSGSGDSYDDQEQEPEPAPEEPVPALENNDGGSGDSEIEIHETSPTPTDLQQPTDVKEYGVSEAQNSGNEDETPKESEPVSSDSVINPEESKSEDNISETQETSQPEVLVVGASQTDSLSNETVAKVPEDSIDSGTADQNPEQSGSVDSNDSSTEATGEVNGESALPETFTTAEREDEPTTQIPEESTGATEAAPVAISEEVPAKEYETPVAPDQDPDETEKARTEEVPSILSRGSDMFPIPVPEPPEESGQTTEINKVTEQPSPDSPRKLGGVDSVDKPNDDSKQKENLQAGVERKATDESDQQSAAKSGISGLNVFIFFVIAAAIAGAAVFGYKLYKNRQVSYRTVNTGEDFGKELQEVKVKRLEDDRNADGQKNSKEAKPLMFNDLDITEIEEQQPHTPQATPRTFKVTPSNVEQSQEDTKKYDQQ